MFEEADLVPISALQHFMYCQRQCALIHVEQIWEDNRFTAEGRVIHKRVHAGGGEKRGDMRRVYDLPIRSLALGLVGRADVVEFHLQQDGLWLPYPVEHKRGRRKREDWDRVQLCAQALSLEEMLGTSIPEGALFYGAQQRREVVELAAALRAQTAETAAAVHRLIEAGETPRPEYGVKCDQCSLVEKCLPKDTGDRERKVSRYLKQAADEP